MKYMTQEITRKIKSKERTPTQQQKQKAHLLKLQHKRSKEEMKRSSKVASTPRGRDDGKKGSERDRMTGERLQNQRPHPLARIEDEEDAH